MSAATPPAAEEREMQLQLARRRQLMEREIRKEATEMLRSLRIAVAQMPRARAQTLIETRSDVSSAVRSLMLQREWEAAIDLMVQQKVDKISFRQLMNFKMPRSVTRPELEERNRARQQEAQRRLREEEEKERQEAAQRRMRINRRRMRELARQNVFRVKAEVAKLLAQPDDTFTAEERAAAYIVLQPGFSRSVKDLMRQLQEAAWAETATMHGDELDERLSDEEVVAWLAKEQQQAEKLLPQGQQDWLINVSHWIIAVIRKARRS